MGKMLQTVANQYVQSLTTQISKFTEEIQSISSVEGLKIEIEVFMKKFEMLDSLLNTIQDHIKDYEDNMFDTK